MNRLKICLYNFKYRRDYLISDYPWEAQLYRTIVVSKVFIFGMHVCSRICWVKFMEESRFFIKFMKLKLGWILKV